MSVLIVGEAPNRSGKGMRANTTRTGQRIAELGGVDLPRTNLLRAYPGDDGKGAAFPVDAARESVRRLERRTPKRVAFLILGKRAARAFGVKSDFLEWTSVRGREVAVFPHPSGINMWWNDARNRAAAAEFFTEMMARCGR